MRSTPTHKEKLLRHGMIRFYATGYHGSSVDAVLEDAAVPKGSFYHHFGSKESFAAAVLHEYYRLSADRLKKWALNFDLAVPERLYGYLDEIAHALEKQGGRNGCLIGKFSLELAPVSDQFSSLLSTMLAAWKSSIQTLLSEGQASGTIRSDLNASDLANLVLSSIQGAVLLSIATRNSESMRQVATTLKKMVSVQLMETP